MFLKLLFTITTTTTTTATTTTTTTGGGGFKKQQFKKHPGTLEPDLTLFFTQALKGTQRGAKRRSRVAYDV